jgi:MarR family transcriptional regulator, organic hydroperoxide resistance regulator
LVISFSSFVNYYSSTLNECLVFGDAGMTIKGAIEKSPARPRKKQVEPAAGGLSADLRKLEQGRVRAWLSVVRAYQICSDCIATELRPSGLTLPQFEVLLALLTVGDQSQQQLAQRSFVVKGHMSGLLVQMEAAGLLRRRGDAADRRSKVVSLTKMGQALAGKAREIQRAVMLDMFAPLNEKQIADTELVMQSATKALAMRQAMQTAKHKGN